jgi:SAM-dependent methyltransferase
MIRRARKNAQRFRLPVQYHVLDFLEFGDHMTESFDALYSLGNSLVHLRDGSERLRALQNFNAVLRPEGMLCIQILNYDKILAERPEVISEKERPPYRFIRRYVYQQDRIKFALEIDGMPEKLLLEQDIFPFRSSDLQAEAENAGFNRVQLTGSLKLDPFMPQTSPNICLWAWKG